MSWGRFGRLLQRLPRTSWTVREVGGDITLWGDVEHRLADVVDLLAQANWMYLSVNRAKNSSVPPHPKPLKRPGVRAQIEGRRIGGTQTYTVDEIEVVFARMRPKGGVADGR